MAKGDKNRETALKRLEIIIPLINSRKGEVSYAQIAKNADLSVKTVRRWVNAYRKQRIKGLIPNYKGSSTIKKTGIRFDDVLTKAMSMRRTDPHISVKNIIFAYESENPDYKGIIKRSTLQRYLQERHYGKHELLTQEKMDGRKCFQRYRRKEILHTLQLDVKEFPKGTLIDAYGAPCSGYIQACIDNCSRKIVSYKVGTDQRGHIVNDCLKQVVSEIGIPKHLHVDNGAIYRSRIFNRACKILNIRIIKCTPFAGYQKGVIERFNGKLNELENQLLAVPGMNYEGFKKLVDIWVDNYNRTAHSILKEGGKYLSPAEYWSRHFTKHETIDDETAAYVFKESMSRKVGKDGLISIGSAKYKVNIDDAPAGSVVELLANPDGTFEQVLADYKTEKLEVFEYPEHASAEKKQGTQNTNKDISFLYALLRNNARAKNRFKDEASFIKEMNDFLFGTSGRKNKNPAEITAKDTTQETSAKTSVPQNSAETEKRPATGVNTGNGKVERGLGNNQSPFLNLDNNLENS